MLDVLKTLIQGAGQGGAPLDVDLNEIARTLAEAGQGFVVTKTTLATLLERQRLEEELLDRVATDPAAATELSGELDRRRQTTALLIQRLEASRIAVTKASCRMAVLQRGMFEARAI